MADAPPWDRLQNEYEPPSLKVFAGGQAPKILLRVKIDLYRYQKEDGGPIEKLLLVDLSGTTASPGKLLANADDKRGYFTERVTVRAWLEDSPSFKLRTDSPPTTPEGGSESSSISYSVSTGSFGTTGTFSAGGTISSGISRSLPDFEIVNRSSLTEMEHVYGLKLVTGSKYSTPLDLFDGSGLGGRIRELNARAISNLPLASSALFHSADEVGGIRRLNIQFTHRLVLIEKTYQAFVSVPGRNSFDKSPDAGRQTHYVPYPGGRVEIDIAPDVTEYNWAFDIDLDQGEVRSAA